ncbi:DUF2188 domain-containing protein [Haloplasma contractile]|uniref:Uncharacterized protein n=1 Tax=Haloplasma contractile SSD-17B TaxID=1033810 RepID=U2FFX2_9MOLU|nr:DUF2188 domain-containing protein [Haloplasma contractile]ERJ11800.1 hypothetical protein HLPCO_002039 [Haloplasma contractile SSD-17B]
MPYSEDNYPNTMKNLSSKIRKKAIEIVNAMIDEGYDESQAIPIAIKQAKDFAATHNRPFGHEITHHLVFNDGKWVIKKEHAKRASFTFDTKEEAMNHLKEMTEKEPIKTMIHDAKGNFQKIY